MQRVPPASGGTVSGEGVKEVLREVAKLVRAARGEEVVDEEEVTDTEWQP